MLRADLLPAYRAVRGETEALCETLTPEDTVVQTMPDVSPTKWHLAHTAWFFEQFVLRKTAEYEPVDERYEVLFNSYYHEAGDRFPRPERGLLSRPTLAEVRAYRRHVDGAMERFLLEATDDRIGAVAFVIELGLHHEQQHQELILTDIKHVFSVSPMEPSLRPALPRSGAVAAPQRFIAAKGGLVEIGHAADGFAFDNEGPRHRVWLEPFEIASRLVTCGEMLAFMADGGYDTPTLWLSDGWDARQRAGWRAPAYFRPADGGWEVMTLGGWRAVDPSEPVCHVSFYEADAFARWAGARLPTEAEWELVAAGRAVSGNFVESGALHPVPAAPSPDDGPAQLFGDVWEWTASPYVPYPGFRPFGGGLGEYNGKFMSSQMVLRGGSCASPTRHLRATYRNFFAPPARWQFAGIRLARG